MMKKAKVKSRNIVWGFHDEADLKEVLDTFGSLTVQDTDVQPPELYEIIGRVGHKGAWVYRELKNKRQWYLTHTLNQFREVELKKKCPECGTILTLPEGIKSGYCQIHRGLPKVDYSDPSKFSPEVREVLGV